MVGAGGTFRLEPETPWHFERSESHIRAWGIFLGTGVRALKVLPILHPYQECGVGFGAAALPGTRIGAAGTSYSYPEHHL